MNHKTVIVQVCICILVFMTVQGGVYPKEGKLGDILGYIAEVVRENYTLADILDLGESAKETLASAALSVGNGVLEANIQSMYGLPLDENSDSDIKNVYAAAGGRVLKTGVRQDIGLYVVIEHSGKISTYGHLCDVRAITGERVKKGDLIASYDSMEGKDFYYVMEDKSGNLL